MRAREIDQMFNFTFEKTAAEIKEKSETKIKSLNAKIEERQRRISALREEHAIDDSALIQLLTAARKQDRHDRMSFSYASNSVVDGKSQMEERTIGAGVVNHLLTENDHVEADKSNVERLMLIVRNLRGLSRVADNGTVYTESCFPLSYDELTFLGF